MYKFYFPFSYFFTVHARTTSRIVSWFFVFVLPVLFSSSMYSNVFDTEFVLSSFILLILLYNIYEVGYIYNDTETIKNETSPTLRLSNAELSYYEVNKVFIYSSRLITSICLIYLLRYIIELDALQLFFISSQSLILFAIYFWYNLVRSRLSIFIATLLGLARYSFIPIFIYYTHYGYFNYSILFQMFFLFPLINVLTWLTKPKYNIKWALRFFSNHDLSRIIYYSIGVLISGLIYMFFGYLQVFLLMMIYFLLLRLSYFFILGADNFISRSVRYARSLKYYDDKK